MADISRVGYPSTIGAVGSYLQLARPYICAGNRTWAAEHSRLFFQDTCDAKLENTVRLSLTAYLLRDWRVGSLLLGRTHRFMVCVVHPTESKFRDVESEDLRRTSLATCLLRGWRVGSILLLGRKHRFLVWVVYPTYVEPRSFWILVRAVMMKDTTSFCSGMSCMEWSLKKVHREGDRNAYSGRTSGGLPSRRHPYFDGLVCHRTTLSPQESFMCQMKMIN